MCMLVRWGEREGEEEKVNGAEGKREGRGDRVSLGE